MHKEFVKMMQTLVTGAFGLIAALAWNTAITKLVGLYFKPGSGLIALFVYAIVITVVAFLAIWSVSRMLKAE